MATTTSYNQAVKRATKLTESPAVIRAYVSVDEPTSLITRKVFNCSRDEWSFNPENIDGKMVYTTEAGEVIFPPAEYYTLSAQTTL